jgi:hypothetical protein
VIHGLAFVDLKDGRSFSRPRGVDRGANAMSATILTAREAAAFYHLIAIARRGGPSDQEIPYVPLLCELAEIPPDRRACYNALPSRPAVS